MHQSFKSITHKNPLVHCKGCRGVLIVFNKEELTACSGTIKFDIRCPHCQKNWHVCVEYKTCLIVELSDDVNKNQS